MRNIIFDTKCRNNRQQYLRINLMRKTYYEYKNIKNDFSRSIRRYKKT